MAYGILFATASLARKAGLAACASIVLLVATGDAHADWIRNSGCVASSGMASCTTVWRKTRGGHPSVIHAAPLLSEQDEREALERDRKWIARCRPLIKQDYHGVSRYHYAAPGCEFGKFED